jgi:hypothetical protein
MGRWPVLNDWLRDSKMGAYFHAIRPGAQSLRGSFRGFDWNIFLTSGDLRHSYSCINKFLCSYIDIF